MQLIWERKYGLCKRKYSLVANNSEKMHNFRNGQSAVFKSSGIMAFKPMLHNLMKMKVKYVTHALDFYFKRKMDWAAFSSLHWHFLLNLHKLLWQLHDRYQDASTTWPAQPRAGHAQQFSIWHPPIRAETHMFRACGPVWWWRLEDLPCDNGKR